MKRYLIWFFLIGKRALKKPAFLLFLIAMPSLLVGISRMEREETAGIEIGLLVAAQDDIDSETEEREEEARRKDFFKRLQEQDSIFVFQSYEDREAMIRDVERGDLYCAFFFPADFWERLREDDWKESITIYSTASADLPQIAKERIAGVVFALYSEECYVNYVQKSDAFAAARIDSESEEELISFARTAYQTNLVNGSTFSFVYEEEASGTAARGQLSETGQLQEAETAYESETRQSQGAETAYGPETGQSQGADMAYEPKAGTRSASAFPQRGILAVCIFLSGLCGLLTDWKDREEKRFVRLAPNWMTTVVNVWIPTVFTSLMTVVTLYLTGQAGAFGKELIDLLCYQFLIAAYCCIIRVVVKKQEAITALIPILTLASMVCAPVWIRLSVYLPVFRLLEKLFPVTYYLL